MRKIDRVKRALAGQILDRPPVSIWHHYPAQDTDPVKLAAAHVAFQEKHDFDFIKITPFDLYCVEDWGGIVRYFSDGVTSPVTERHAVLRVDDWLKLKVLPPETGTWGKQVLLTKYVKQLAKSDVPVVQTVYSPLTVARKLAGDQLVRHIREYPQIVHRALQVITATTEAFITANLAAGADGIFFATACANHDFITPAEYEAFGRPYDLAALAAAKGGWFNTLHIHGRNIMFDEFLDYPVQAINWHDCHEYPPVRRARAMTDLCIIGGLDEEGPVVTGKPIDVIDEVSAFLAETNLRGVMVGPGCVTVPNPPEYNLTAVRLVVERYAEADSWKYLSLDSSFL